MNKRTMKKMAKAKQQAAEAAKTAETVVHEPSERDTDFSSTPLHKQGQELRSEQTAINIHEQNSFTYFLCLNNSEIFVDEAF